MNKHKQLIKEFKTKVIFVILPQNRDFLSLELKIEKENNLKELFLIAISYLYYVKPYLIKFKKFFYVVHYIKTKGKKKWWIPFFKKVLML